MIEGLSHITFMMRDLDRMEKILTSVLDAKRVYDSGDQTFSVSREKFFLVGAESAAVWIAIIEGESLPTQTYNHVAFKISDTDYPACLERVRSLGLEVREGRSRVEGEGRSIYFHDDDNHLFELHTGALVERLKRYASEWDERFTGDQEALIGPSQSSLCWLRKLASLRAPPPMTSATGEEGDNL